MRNVEINQIFIKPVAILSVLLLLFMACSSDDDSTDTSEGTDDSDSSVVNVNTSYFTTEDESVIITIVPCTLSDGTVTDCYQVVTSSLPTDHNMGPWCPDNISDDAEAGGIWLEDGEVHDVDGAFIENLATFYNDDNWMMYDGNGDIYITESEEDCINAANPDVGEEYENFCVECLPAYISDLTQTWLIPITPVLQDTSLFFTTEGGGAVGPGGPGEVIESVPSTRGIALNGIEFSAPAPTDNILSAYTIAPFDDAGGHINVHQGYHYHAATGFSTKVEQEDGHAALIGYALDGIGIYELEDEDGNEAIDLDELRGHTDEARGYHYHVDEAGNNNFINGLKGAYAI
ncbi:MULTISPECIES: YHYH protein [Winogradskyella]|uniref:YHYH protein n=1 Tax=Winogradskyella TaxID=286104 RepID=UPI0015CCCB03|nr:MULTISPECIES: YHYH protein [Winogradskyella]QXP79641.1 YHYH protein [Winogradskyella sp. HaHa_3_26]